MRFFTVSIFGHRKIEELWRLEAPLLQIVKNLIQSNNYVSFLIGRNGELDEFAAAIIKHYQSLFYRIITVEL